MIPSARKLLSAGLLLAAAGLAGAYVPRWMLAGGALGDIGYPFWGSLLAYGAPPAFLGTLLLWGLLAYVLPEMSWAGRFSRCFLPLFLWVLPCEILESRLAAYDFGSPSLSAAAAAADASAAKTVGVLILAEADGGPGSRYRERVLAARGLEATPENISAVRSYLARRGYRTVHLRQALDFLREGAKLNWDAEGYLEAAMLRVEPGFPPDTLGFLEAVSVAPATTENYGRLEKMGSYAWYDRIPSIKGAQKTFEGFSTAYARFGELDNSNMWLDRVRGLWPLFEDNIHIEPLESSHDGAITGRLHYAGAPAAGLKVGLFARPSTSTAVEAASHLVASSYPDESGRFEFSRLLPGKYYLALMGDPLFLDGEGLVFRNAPGEISLSPLDNKVELLALEIERAGKSSADPPGPAGLPGFKDDAEGEG